MAEQKKIKPSLRNLAAGDVIFREGEVGDFAYQVVKGKIEVTKFNGDEYVTLALLEKGALFGEMALIDKQPRSAMARAVNEATVREIDKDALLGYLKNSPQTAFNMMQQLASYARNANEKLSVDAFSSEESNTSDEIEEESEENKEKRKKKLILNELLDEFDDDIDRLKSKVLPKSVKYSVYSFGFLVLFLIIWGSISEIDTTISATGKITTVVPNVEVQSNYNSVVKKIFVKKGQEVEKGEPLVAFDSTLQRADMKKLNYQLSVTNSKIDRLKKQSELRSNSSVSNPSDDRQNKIFKDKKGQYLAKMASLDQKISSTEDDLTFIKEQLDIQKQLEDSKKELFDLDLVAEAQVLGEKNKRLSLEKEFTKTSNTLGELKSNRKEYTSQFFGGINDELMTLEDQRISLLEDLKKLERQQTDETVRAPSDGMILDLHSLYPGAVISQGKSVVTLVPTGVELLTVFDVDPSDISKLIPDTSVKIQLNALPAQKHGELKGKLIYVSADTIDKDVDGNSGNFYRARAKITEQELKDIPPGFNLMPGMKVSGKFRVGKRKLITYFIYPLIRTLGNSFAEP
ncbi:MAG: HlyD family type I secretion periplasmic adaptor subunit [Alphaproteobacteria bacterium]|tara:strand:- start:8200 stop:9918 length:1719 start_codon:yes stop_codon:yes gene_type:complete